MISNGKPAIIFRIGRRSPMVTLPVTPLRPMSVHIITAELPQTNVLPIRAIQSRLLLLHSAMPVTSQMMVKSFVRVQLLNPLRLKTILVKFRIGWYHHQKTDPGYHKTGRKSILALEPFMIQLFTAWLLKQNFVNPTHPLCIVFSSTPGSPITPLALIKTYVLMKHLLNFQEVIRKELPVNTIIYGSKMFRQPDGNPLVD